MIIWTIGAGGFLGRAITRQALRHGIGTFDAAPIPWTDEDAAATALQANATAFAEHVDAEDWGILWAAGHTDDPLDPDRDGRLLNAAITAIALHRPAGRGAFFLSSVAGLVYAGSAHPPFDEFTEPRPRTDAGRAQLDREQLAINGLDGVCPVVIGRLGSLFGAGQDIHHPHGLIPRLAVASLSQQPLTLTSSLESTRDFLDVDDAALLALHWTSRALQHPQSPPAVRVIASGQPVSLGALVHLMQDLEGRPVPVRIQHAGGHEPPATDLRLTPSDDGTALGLVRTSLPAGIRRVVADAEEQWRQASKPRR